MGATASQQKYSNPCLTNTLTRPPVSPIIFSWLWWRVPCSNTSGAADLALQTSFQWKTWFSCLRRCHTFFFSEWTTSNTLQCSTHTRTLPWLIPSLLLCACLATRYFLMLHPPHISRHVLFWLDFKFVPQICIACNICCVHLTHLLSNMSLDPEFKVHLPLCEWF